MSSEAPLIDLHGTDGQPFPSFGEDWSYLERMTMTTRGMAQRTLARESGMNPEEHDPQPVYMRFDDGEQISERTHGEYDEGWFECEADHPDAVPFWKDAP